MILALSNQWILRPLPKGPFGSRSQRPVKLTDFLLPLALLSVCLNSPSAGANLSHDVNELLSLLFADAAQQLLLHLQYLRGQLVIDRFTLFTQADKFAAAIGKIGVGFDPVIAPHARYRSANGYFVHGRAYDDLVCRELILGANYDHRPPFSRSHAKLRLID